MMSGSDPTDMEERLVWITADRDRLQAENVWLRELIDAAPHSQNCGQTPIGGFGDPCNCIKAKAKALTQSDEGKEEEHECPECGCVFTEEPRQEDAL